jgi:hypothetical protein
MSPSARALHRELNRLKKADRADGGVPWMYGVSKRTVFDEARTERHFRDVLDG